MLRAQGRRGAGALAVAFVAVALVAGGCAERSPRSAGPAATVTVLAAASLTEAFQGLAAGPPARYSFAGSQQVVAQVEAGAPADVVALADPDTMARLVRQNLVEAPAAFATNRLALAVRPGNPQGVGVLADLARPGLSVVLADRSVPAGRYAHEVLDRAGVTVRPVSEELDVKAVVARVASGEADAGIAYATDIDGEVGVSGVAIPVGANVVAVYGVAVLRSPANPAGARAFVDTLLGPAGREALSRRGFGLP